MGITEMCYNARETGMLDDPRTNFNTPIDGCPKYLPKHLLDKIPIPRVCGNCEWYCLQEEDNKNG